MLNQILELRFIHVLWWLILILVSYVPSQKTSQHKLPIYITSPFGKIFYHETSELFKLKHKQEKKKSRIIEKFIFELLLLLRKVFAFLIIFTFFRDQVFSVKIFFDTNIYRKPSEEDFLKYIYSM